MLSPFVAGFCQRLYFIILLLCLQYPDVLTYYKKYQCFGTGDCLIETHTGGLVDDQHRWAVECHDGEAMIGINDGGDFGGIGEVWCKFMFPKKKPSYGIYPYYEYCNVRDINTMFEYYCYDKYYPIDTYDTFVTAFSSSQSFTEGSNGEIYKCCKLPHGYHLDYSRCEYKYTHDKMGEHYNENNLWPAKCDRDFLLTGMGKAADPWTASMHYVWVQCCPLFFDPSYVPLFVHANETLHREAGIGHQYYVYNNNSYNSSTM